MMKVALLNLPIDKNYGGNLQRFALCRTLTKMDVEVTHLNLQYELLFPAWKRYYLKIKWALQSFLGSTPKVINDVERQKKYIDSLHTILPFYNKYVPHTQPLSLSGLKKCLDYDCFIVGSDQVWRKNIALEYLDTMFFNYLPRNKSRIAYSVSFGSDTNELSLDEINKLGQLYQNFDAVSVREESGLALLKEYGWHTPQAIHLIDPTFLVDKSEYEEIVNQGNTEMVQGDIYTYILDPTDETSKIIQAEESRTGYKSYGVELNDSTISIEQWLRNFKDAQLVITDSFHGLVFSIIFNKHYILIRNKQRGNSRFDSLLKTFKLTDQSNLSDWSTVNEIIRNEREKSYKFLTKSLKGLKYGK